MIRSILLFITLFISTIISAQRLDHHDILLMEIRQNPDGSWQTFPPSFITAFNRSGYNNQPKFFNDYSLWLTVQNSTDTTQTDIYQLDLIKKALVRITNTPSTSEYSPTPMPGGQRFSAVRVDEDNQQRLWTFPLDGSDNGRSEFPDILNVGYHCWLGDKTIAFFIVGDDANPHTLQILDVNNKNLRKIASNIGRCLLQTTDGKLAFVQKPTNQTWFLKTWNPLNNTQDILVKMPTETEDFAQLSDGTFICGSGPKLYSYKSGKDQDWRQVSDLSRFGVKTITRLASSKLGKLAVVVE